VKRLASATLLPVPLINIQFCSHVFYLTDPTIGHYCPPPAIFLHYPNTTYWQPVYTVKTDTRSQFMNDICAQAGTSMTVDCCCLLCSYCSSKDGCKQILMADVNQTFSSFSSSASTCLLRTRRLTTRVCARHGNHPDKIAPVCLKKPDRYH